MKNLFYIVFSVISALSVYAGNRLHIIDDGDKSPVVAATVFSRSGNIRACLIINVTVRAVSRRADFCLW